MALALVTGSSRGIGKAIALRLADDGHDVIVTYRGNEAAAREVADAIVAKGRQAWVAQLDVADGPETSNRIAALIKEHGCPAIVVNNAGVTKDGMFAMMSQESWDSVIDTNLGGLYAVTRPVARQMLRARSGCIVNITSVAGMRGNAGQVNYSAAKAGVVGATKALAHELAPRGIRVNAVAPGFIETDMVADVDLDQVLPAIPLGRTGTADEVADAVSFLCSDDAAYITGQVLSVNGGLYT